MYHLFEVYQHYHPKTLFSILFLASLTAIYKSGDWFVFIICQHVTATKEEKVSTRGPQLNQIHF